MCSMTKKDTLFSATTSNPERVAKGTNLIEYYISVALKEKKTLISIVLFLLRFFGYSEISKYLDIILNYIN